MSIKSVVLAAMFVSVLLAGHRYKAASAHSGRTNSRGCHNNNHTGDYHCHNGDRTTQPIYRPNVPTRPTTAPATPDQTSWVVLSVGDGDTLRISRDSETVTVRLACIDAPEIAQAHGESARARLQTILPVNTPVSLRTVNTDRYGRTVAEVFSQDTNINLSLVQSGHAVAYRRYLNSCDQDAYLTAEHSAQQEGLAFWSTPNPTMPWDFRRQNR